VSTVTCVKLVCLGTLTYGLCHAAVFVMHATEYGVHPFGLVYGVLVIATTAVAGLGILYRRAARPAVLCIALCVVYQAGAAILPDLIKKAPALFNQIRFFLPNFLGVVALAVWACGS
jgi:hypothetical protein